VIGPEIEHVGEIADRPAESPAQGDGDRRTLPRAPQLGHEHRRVGPHRAYHDRRRRGPVAEPLREGIGGAAGRLVAKSPDAPGETGPSRLVADNEDL
jgi:hypothetical protein